MAQRRTGDTPEPISPRCADPYIRDHGSFLLTYIYFNPSMENQLHLSKTVGWNYLSIRRTGDTPEPISPRCADPYIRDHGSFLLTYIYFNPSMENQLHLSKTVGWNYLSIRRTGDTPEPISPRCADPYIRDHGSFLLTYIYFNPSMENQLHLSKTVGWNYLSIPKLQRLDRWDWEWISNFIPQFALYVITYH